MASAGAEGAAAAASYFISLYPYVLATGDLDEWNSLSAETCDFCAKTRAEVERLQSAGHHTVGGVTVVSTSGKDLGANNWYAAEVSIRLDPSSDVDENGNVVATNGGGDYDLDFAMTWADRWVIDSVGFVEQPAG